MAFKLELDGSLPFVQPGKAIKPVESLFHSSTLSLGPVGFAHACKTCATERLYVTAGRRYLCSNSFGR